jgi:hypothetical protein
MRKETRVRAAVILGLLLAAAPAAWPQVTGPQAEYGAPAYSPAAPGQALRYVSVVFSDGRMVSGFLLGVGERTLVLRRGRATEAISLAGVRRVAFERNKYRAALGLLGGVLGFYYSEIKNRGVYKAEPWAVTDQELDSDILLLALATILPGSLVYFGSGFLQGDTVDFRFEGGPVREGRAWVRLRDFVVRGPLPRTVRLQTIAGKITSGSMPGFASAFRAAGYSHNYHYSQAAPPIWPYSGRPVNLMRRLQIMVPVRGPFAAGAVLVHLGEPGQAMIRYFEAGSEATSSSVQSRLDAKGLFLAGSWGWRPARLGGLLEARLGAGLGAVKGRLDLTGSATQRTKISTKWSYYYEYSDSRRDISLRKTRPAALLFAELNLFVSPFFSLGLTGDYVLAPREQAPALPDYGLPARAFRFGSGCLGFVLGLHF